MKKLVNVYKTYLLHVGGVEPDSTSISKPFIRLNIQCIIGSYDLNVTTAKDEVLFANESKVLSLFEEMCKEMYLPTEPRVVAEVVEECVQMGKSQNRDTSPRIILSVHDGEQLNVPLDRVKSDSTVRGESSDFLPNGNEPHFAEVIQEPTPNYQGRVVACPPSSINGTHIATPIDKDGFGGSVCSHVETHQQNQTVPIGNEEALYGSSAIAIDDPNQAPRQYTGEEATGIRHPERNRWSFPRNAELQHSTEPTQYLLRTGWEVDMSRDKTASPEGNTQPIFLDPPRSDLIQYLQSQRLDQEHREKPNPWTIAKNAADKRGVHEHSISSYLSGVTQRDDTPTTTISCERLPLPRAEDFVQRGSDMAHSSSKDQGHIQPLHDGRQREPVVQREDVYEASDLEPFILQYPTAPQGDLYGLRHQGQRRIARDDEPFRPAGKGHDVNKLDIHSARSPDVGQHAYSKTPHSFANFDQKSALGTPPPSSSPLHKPFRGPARVEPRKQQQYGQRPRGARRRAARAVDPRADGLRRGKIVLNARRCQEPLTPKRTKGDCFDTMEADHTGFRDNYVGSETSTHPHRHDNGDLPSEEMEKALERLNALRPRTRNTDYTEDQGKGEERGRALSQKPASTVPDTSPRSYLRQRLASRSRSRSKTHKRMKSEMLPFEKQCSEAYTHMQSLILDLNKMKKQVFSASDYDLYVLRGQQEAAFPLEPIEMEDISSRLQAVLGAWAYKEHGVELELEIDIGALFEGSDMSCMTE
ncbi:uncharacterized protein GLRG_03887 [Colletotrichum graminicola M1.001]|uniref:Uncharacterized protein n=1 Tax=Colletotrichum graminicola (strain M1.001 / M2 / FGSC 10212) TaxID=645133 RepID=E3QCX1_COLGM|nr:uncharacterized protein GLRG_03887 [Colletotrichum graminicola M1.001]EFQ28743.1 hypothetical protein GLRG_03887 [Colletotrichum graminicola M1.001]